MTLVAFASDGAGVMLGKNSGVASCIVKKYPNGLARSCLNHRLDLAAAEKLSEVRAVNHLEIFDKLYTLYSRSPKTKTELSGWAAEKDWGCQVHIALYLLSGITAVIGPSPSGCISWHTKRQQREVYVCWAAEKKSVPWILDGSWHNVWHVVWAVVSLNCFSIEILCWHLQINWHTVPSTCWKPWEKNLAQSHSKPTAQRKTWSSGPAHWLKTWSLWKGMTTNFWQVGSIIWTPHYSAAPRQSIETPVMVLLLRERGVW